MSPTSDRLFTNANASWFPDRWIAQSSLQKSIRRGLVEPATAAANTTAFVTALYQDLFSRTPDTPGLTYWTNYLSSNLSSSAIVGTFPLAMINGAQNSLTSLDETTIGNKAAVSEFLVQQFTAAHIDFDAAASALAHIVVAQVNQTPASVTAAEVAVVEFVHQQSVPLVGIAATA